MSLVIDPDPPTGGFGDIGLLFNDVSSDIIASPHTPKEAQEAMGLADIRTTPKAVPGWQEQAAAKLDALPRGATGLWVPGRTSRDSRGPKPSGRERFPSG